MADGRLDQIDIVCLCNWHGIGGAQLNAGLLTTEFELRGYRAELGFLFEREPNSRHGTRSHFVISARAPRTPADWWRFYQECRRQLIGRRPRAIIGFQPMANMVGALAASNIKGCHMIATQRNPSDKQSPRVGYLERVVGNTRLYRANVAVSETVAASFDGYPSGYRRRLQVVHNATPPLVEVDDDRGKCRALFAMPEDRMILGSLGRLHPQKNLLFALDVLAALPDTFLAVAGEGPDEQVLRRRAFELGISDRVNFVGALRGADVTRFYRSLDAFLFPSLYEGFGRALVEAMSQGVPVIASDIPIVREVGGDSVLLTPLDVGEWVEAVTRLANDKAFAAHLDEHGRQRSKVFGLSEMVSGYLAAAGLPEYQRNPASR